MAARPANAAGRSAAGAARAASRRTRRGTRDAVGQTVERALRGRRNLVGGAACSTQALERRVDARVARTGGRRATGRRAAASALRRSITLARSASATPPRSRREYASRTRSRCARAASTSCSPAAPGPGVPAGPVGRSCRPGPRRAPGSCMTSRTATAAAIAARPATTCGRRRWAASGGVSTTASVAPSGRGRLDMHDRQPGPGRGQAPAVPAGDDLVQVVPVGLVAGRAVERRELQEADVRHVRQHADTPPGSALSPSRGAGAGCASRGLVVPDLDPDAAHEVVEQQLTRAVVGGQRLGLLEPRADLGGPFAPGDARTRSTAACRVPTWPGRRSPRSRTARPRVRRCWSSLSPEASGSRSRTTHSSSPSGSAPPTHAALDRAANTGAVDDDGGLARRQDLQVGAPAT